MREDIIGRANVEDTLELQAYYRDLEKYDTGALWTVANKIEPWQPQSSSAGPARPRGGGAPGGRRCGILFASDQFAIAYDTF